MASRTDISSSPIKFESTPQNGVKAKAYLTRTGVFSYTNSDGSQTRELRHPDEVFDPKSLETLEGAPLTVNHPSGRVDQSNWKQLTTGHTASVLKKDRYVQGTVIVNDAQAVEQVRNGSLVELSCGYDCELDQEQGIYQGEHYDAVQRNIRYNHVALLPKGAGRAGPDVRIRNDSSYTIITERMEKPEMAEDNKNLTELLKSASERADSATTKLDSLTAELDKTAGERDALKSELEATKDKLTEALDTKRIDSAIRERLSLVSAAHKILGTKEDFSGKSKTEILSHVISKTDSKFSPEGKSEGYLEGRFEQLLSNSDTAVNPGLAKVAEVMKDLPRADAKDKEEKDEWEKKMDEKRKDMWKQPTSVSKKSK